MKFGPLEIRFRRKDAGIGMPLGTRASSSVREWAGGFWQQGITVDRDVALSFHAFYSCVTLIAADIGKLRPKLMEQQESTIWLEVTSSAYTPVLRKPNKYQNHIQFKEWWMLSKLIRGNTYALKERDKRQVVTGLYVLDPDRVTPLVAPNGDVYYRLAQDDLSGLPNAMTVPASEIIHDRMNCLFHPLCGVPPIYACGIAAGQGLSIIRDSSKFFANGARPSGILTAPGSIGDDTAKRLKDHWDQNYSGENAGRVAVLGDGLKFEMLRMNAVDAQLIDQLKYTAENVCSTFHVPPFMAGVGAAPTYNNVEALSQQYYSQCLQAHIESMELCLDEGLGIGVGVNITGRSIGVELDLDGLLRMDQSTAMKTIVEGVKGGVVMPDEGRLKLNLPPVPGGDTIYMQQQEFSLAALAKRDALPNPFVIDQPTTNPTPSADGPPANADSNAGKEMLAIVEKSAADVSRLSEIVAGLQQEKALADFRQEVVREFAEKATCDAA